MTHSGARGSAWQPRSVRPPLLSSRAAAADARSRNARRHTLRPRRRPFPSPRAQPYPNSLTRSLSSPRALGCRPPQGTADHRSVPPLRSLPPFPASYISSAPGVAWGLILIPHGLTRTRPFGSSRRRGSAGPSFRSMSSRPAGTLEQSAVAEIAMACGACAKEPTGQV